MINFGSVRSLLFSATRRVTSRPFSLSVASPTLSSEYFSTNPFVRAGVPNLQRPSFPIQRPYSTTSTNSSSTIQEFSSLEGTQESIIDPDKEHAIDILLCDLMALFRGKSADMAFLHLQRYKGKTPFKGVPFDEGSREWHYDQLRKLPGFEPRFHYLDMENGIGLRKNEPHTMERILVLIDANAKNMVAAIHFRFDLTYDKCTIHIMGIDPTISNNLVGELLTFAAVITSLQYDCNNVVCFPSGKEESILRRAGFNMEKDQFFKSVNFKNPAERQHMLACWNAITGDNVNIQHYQPSGAKKFR